MTLQVDAVFLQQRGLLWIDLIVKRLGRPTWQVVDIHKRVVIVADQTYLLLEFDFSDVLTARVCTQLAKFMKVMKAYAATLEYFMDWRKNDVAHASLHLVHQRAAIPETHLEHASQHRSR